MNLKIHAMILQLQNDRQLLSKGRNKRLISKEFSNQKTVSPLMLYIRTVSIYFLLIVLPFFSAQAQTIPELSTMFETLEGGGAIKFKDYLIPSTKTTFIVTLEGGDGGSFLSPGEPCYAAGGKGMSIYATFTLNSLCGGSGDNFEAGGTIRFILGEKGEDAKLLYYGTGITGFFYNHYAGSAGGGGGSAMLYKAPGSTNWQIILVAGGGGGAEGRYNLDGGCIESSPGENASFNSSGKKGKGYYSGNGGESGNGGWGSSYSNAGGGAFTKGQSSRNSPGAGSAGGTEGGQRVSETFFDVQYDFRTVVSSYGGFGFGGGGSGCLKQHDPGYTGAGGGGGYSGGGGGQGYVGGGGGGGSYLVSTNTTGNFKIKNSPPGEGYNGRAFFGIYIQGNQAPTLESNIITSLEVQGCSIFDGTEMGGAYSSSPESMSIADFNRIGGVIKSNLCPNEFTVKYQDGLIISTSIQSIFTRSFTISSNGNSDLHATQQITVKFPKVAILKDLSEKTYTTTIDGKTVTLGVEISGYKPGFQWYTYATGQQPVPISTGGQTPSYTPAANVNGTFHYFVRITSPCGETIQSKTATIIVSPKIWPDVHGIIYVTPTGNGNKSGNSWTNATNNLQNAISVANRNKIWVAKGTYYPDDGGGNALGDRSATFTLHESLSIYGGFAGTETILSQRNLAANPTILNGDIGISGNNSDNSFHVVTSQSVGVFSRLDGFIISGGNAGSGSNQRGGGIYNGDKSTAIIANCIIRDNNAVFGGGIYNESRSNTTIINCLLTGNTASSDGGGICIGPDGLSTIINTTISGNTKSGLLNVSGTSTLKNCIIWDNEAGVAGPLTISNSIIQGGFIGTGNLNTDPLFVDAANGNFRLQLSSPAKNKGENGANTEMIDLDGNPRKSGIIDLGPYEVNCFPGNIFYVNKNATGSNDGSSWADAFTNLQDALSSRCPNISQIWVAEGTYKPSARADNMDVSNPNDRNNAFLLIKDVKIYGGFAGTETSLNQRDSTGKTKTTILSGDLGVVNNTEDNAYHVVISAGYVGVAELNGFTIKGGKTGENGQISSPSSHEIFNYGGGGVYIISSLPALSNLTISENIGGLGGGVYMEGSSPVLTNVIINGNSGSDGGGVYMMGSNPIMTNGVIHGNKGTSGGGIHINNSSPILTNMTIGGNLATASSMGGGGIFCQGNSYLKIRNTIIFGNSTGIGISSPSTAEITHSLVQELTDEGNGNISGIKNPLFVNAPAPGLTTSGNYRLQNGSPAYNKGKNTFYDPGSIPNLSKITTDLDGGVRIYNQDIDLGAYENQKCLPGSILYVKSTATGSNDGSSWSNAMTNLEDALLNQTCASVIRVAKGTYQPPVNSSFVMKNDLAIYGGFPDTGNPTMEDRDWQAYPTILKGNGTRVINNNFTNDAPLLASAVLDGFTITGGTVTGQSQSGAGIYNHNASPSFINLMIRGNNADWDGGGIFNEFSSPVLTNVIVSGNKASWGGGIYNNNSSSPILTNVTISGNEATSGGGGVINVNSSPKIRNSIVYGNSHGVIDFDGNSISHITYSLVQGRSDESNGNVSGAKDPLFVAPLAPGLSNGGDYQLKSNSPAINKGKHLYFSKDSLPNLSAIQKDLNGHWRTKNGRIDLGAYEGVAIIPANGIVYVTETGNGALTGSDWANATNDLQKAINNLGVQQVWVARGTYKPPYSIYNIENDNPNSRFKTFVLKKDVKIYGGFEGTETMVAERNLSKTANTSILSGDLGMSNDISDNAYHVVVSVGNVGTAELNGFTVSGGNANGPIIIFGLPKSINYGMGGGIYIESSSPLLTNLRVTGNNTGDIGMLSGGGGIYNDNSFPLLTNVVISGNNSNDKGGGIYNHGSSPVLTNVTISGNKASISDGGMLNVNSSPKIRNSIIYGNSDNISGTGLIITHSLVQGLTDETNGNISGAKDPMFINPLTPGLSSGGNYRLLRSVSPAFNKGSNIFYSESSIPDLSAITTDLAGEARIQHGVIDMGAYELNGCPPGNILYVNANAAGENNGSSWTDAFTNLQDALALSCTNVTEVWVANATYFPDQGGGNTIGDRNATFTIKNKLAVYGGFTGTETLLSERNLAANSTILSGDIGTANLNTDNA